jgi:hypothetical protein
MATINQLICFNVAAGINIGNNIPNQPNGGGQPASKKYNREKVFVRNKNLSIIRFRNFPSKNTVYSGNIMYIIKADEIELIIRCIQYLYAPKKMRKYLFVE